MEHIEEAGIHSGDSACSLPPYSLSKEIVDAAEGPDQGARQGPPRPRADERAVRDQGQRDLRHRGQPPRQSRTVPFVGKATGIPWAKIAAKVMAGQDRSRSSASPSSPTRSTSRVKEVVFPFSKFPGVDVILGPEMRRTGEVMGIDANFPLAFAKSQIAAGTVLPTKGTRLHLRPRRRQGGDRPDRQDAGRLRLRAHRHRRHATTTLAQARHPGDAHQQARRGPAEHQRLHQERQGAAHHQHADEEGPADGRGEDPRDGGAEQGADRHDDHRRQRRGEGDRRRCRRSDWGVQPLQEYVGGEVNPGRSTPEASGPIRTLMQRPRRGRGEGRLAFAVFRPPGITPTSQCPSQPRRQKLAVITPLANERATRSTSSSAACCAAIARRRTA